MTIRDAFVEIFDNLGLTGRLPGIESFLTVYEKYNEHLWTEYRKGKVKKEHMRIERIVLTFGELGIVDNELARRVGDLYVDNAPRKTNLFPDVKETLEYLNGKYRLYILTNGFSEIQVRKINNCGLKDYFTKLFMAEMVGYQKPDRRFFEYAVKSVHAHKNECLMIGDDPMQISVVPGMPEWIRFFSIQAIKNPLSKPPGKLGKLPNCRVFYETYRDAQSCVSM